MPPQATDEFIASLSHNALMALPWLFEHWAHPHQLAPEGDWSTWVIMGGRGAGKTRAGSEWVRSMVEGATPLSAGRAKRIALVGETYDQVRDVMIKGESGLLAVCPPDRRPDLQVSNKQLIWKNGAVAQMFSASDPDALRGPQFDAAWADELAKWKKASEAWEMLQLCLRLGDNPRCVVTTTPRDVAAFKKILTDARTAVTTAPTKANRAYLASGYIERVEALLAGSSKIREELDGELVEGREGAFWSRGLLEKCRISEAPPLDRIVVAVDPAVTSGKSADECGIVVAGAQMQGSPQDWRAFVLEDASVKGTATTWMERALQMLRKWEADRIVAEVNQGGDIVEDLLRTVDGGVPYKGVRATRGKVVRAEPIAALYERGRVFHVGGFAQLEDQMCAISGSGFHGRGSPDRADALVWALTELMVTPTKGWADPGIRSL